MLDNLNYCICDARLSGVVILCWVGTTINILLLGICLTLNKHSRIIPLAQPTKFRGVICIEGNIGSGKSTLLSGLQRTGMTGFPEPVESRWREYLSTFYKNKSRWGFTFQIEVLEWFTHLRTLLSRRPRCWTWKPSNTLVLVERSPMATYHIFAKNMRMQGHMTAWEMNLLQRLLVPCGWIPEHTLMVWTPYKEAGKRIHKRGRTAEKKIAMELLHQLELRHEAFLNSGLCGQVHILDGTLSKND